MDIPTISPYTQPEIIAETQRAWHNVNELIAPQSVEAFHYKPTPQQWSAAENLDHLFKSTKPLIKALGAPKLFLKNFGKPNRDPRPYEGVANRYQERLAKIEVIPNEGFTPDFEPHVAPAEMLETWQSLGKKYTERIGKWSETELDKYLLPHPLLGKVHVREMLFFTVYHTYHHLRIMHQRVSQVD